MRINQIVFLLLVVFLAGCDVDWPKSETNCGVNGQLTLDGQAVADVKIVFVPQLVGKKGSLNKIASGQTNDRGEFVMEVNSEKSKQIKHGQYRVIISKKVDGEELFHESYNTESMLKITIDSHQTVQRPTFDLVASGTY